MSSKIFSGKPSIIEYDYMLEKYGMCKRRIRNSEGHCANMDILIPEYIRDRTLIFIKNKQYPVQIKYAEFLNSSLLKMYIDENELVNITDIKIGNTVKAIQNNTFSGMANLSALTFQQESQLISVDTEALANLNEIKSFELPISYLKCMPNDVIIPSIDRLNINLYDGQPISYNDVARLFNKPLLETDEDLDISQAIKDLLGYDYLEFDQNNPGYAKVYNNEIETQLSTYTDMFKTITDGKIYDSCPPPSYTQPWKDNVNTKPPLKSSLLKVSVGTGNWGQTEPCNDPYCKLSPVDSDHPLPPGYSLPPGFRMPKAGGEESRVGSTRNLGWWPGWMPEITIQGNAGVRMFFCRRCGAAGGGASAGFNLGISF